MSWWDDVTGGAGSLWDDVVNLGEGALEIAGENADAIFGDGSDSSSNPGSTQQPNAPIVDNNGNAVTTPQGDGYLPVTADNTLLYVGGGALVLVLILVLVLAVKK